MVHVYNGILLSHKMNEIMPFAATWMDLEIMVSSNTEKDKYHMISLIYGYHLYKDIKKWNKLIYKP